MADLIPYMQRLIGAETVPTVDGRDVHQFLGIARDYSDWMRRQITRAHLVENRDYIRVVSPAGARPITEYFVTFDAAKHIGMLSNTAKGIEVREYFLACEKQLQQTPRTPQVKSRANQMLIDAIVRLDEVEQHALQAEQVAHQAERAALAAERTAHLALAGQQWLSIRQYVVLHGLARQMPPALARDYGRWLTGLCRERGLPVYVLQSTEDWQEHTYPHAVLQDTCAAWLKRRAGQATLTVVHTQ